MNYYPFNVGDYAAHTGHLEPMEDLAYRRLLDQYYLREGPLPEDIEACAKLVRMRSMKADVESVLNEFFVLTDEGWTHRRCDAEIDRMQDKQAKARASAAASVNARRANAERSLKKQQTDVERSLPETQADVELPTPTPTPTPEQKKPSATSPAKLPTCPTQDLIDLYHEILPDLPRVRLQTRDRSRSLQKTWAWCLTSKRGDGSPRAENSEQAMQWFRDYFSRAGQNDFLMGRTQRNGEHANWRCDLDFLLTDRGMKHVIEKTLEPA